MPPGDPRLWKNDSSAWEWRHDVCTVAWIAMAVVLLICHGQGRGIRACLCLPFERAWTAALRKPNLRSLALCPLNLLVSGAGIVALGYAFGTLRGIPMAPRGGLLGLLRCLVFPGMLTGVFEETLFRAMLIPPRDQGGSSCCSCCAKFPRSGSPEIEFEYNADESGTSDGEPSTVGSLPSNQELLWSRTRSIWFSSCYALAVFLIYHLDMMHRFRMFSDPGFLAMAALLGVSCTVAFVDTGSVWAPALIHATYLAVWFSCF
mmetsp:Transcript_99558/g.277139  ORF Transcript_99558/g.277139 Transcript_99558/m.277139 type:complete len:261 (+) Transcript_99558:108-890(+)